MSQPNNPQEQHKQQQQLESTYRAYTTTQASTYNRARGAYPPKLISHILNEHLISGGQTDLLVDVGCGPGNSTQQLALASTFKRAVGVDPSLQMIEVAQEVLSSSSASTGSNSGPGSGSGSGTSNGVVSSSGATAIEFQIGEAEDLAELFPPETIDLLTAATSAHWFNMSHFWRAAERVVKPGGTVALFMIWRACVHPDSCENAAKVHGIIRKLETETLAEWEKEGNWCVIGLYEDLVMPWQLRLTDEGGEERIEGTFARDVAKRVVWNEDGLPGDDGKFMSGERVLTIGQVQEMLGSQSAVTRWREAHPELVGGEEDCAVQAIKEIRQIVGPDVHELRMVGPTVLWLLKKKP